VEIVDDDYDDDSKLVEVDWKSQVAVGTIYGILEQPSKVVKYIGQTFDEGRRYKEHKNGEHESTRELFNNENPPKFRRLHQTAFCVGYKEKPSSKLLTDLEVLYVAKFHDSVDNMMLKEQANWINKRKKRMELTDVPLDVGEVKRLQRSYQSVVPTMLVSVKKSCQSRYIKVFFRMNGDKKETMCLRERFWKMVDDEKKKRGCAVAFSDNVERILGGRPDKRARVDDNESSDDESSYDSSDDSSSDEE